MRGLLIFATTLFVCLLLPQRVLHGVDGNVFVAWIEAGNSEAYARHAAYLHLGSLVYAAVEPFGVGGFAALRLISAIGTAFGLVFVHSAFRLLLPANVSALLATLAVFATPSCFYYATQAEIPGVYFAGAGLAWWMFARWLEHPSAGRAAGVGAAGAAAGALHALGHLLPPSFVLVTLALRRLPDRGGWPQLGTAIGVQLSCALLLSWSLTSGVGGQTADALALAHDYWKTFAPETAPAVLYREWFLPFLPWSIGALLALRSKRSRPLAIATLAAVALYLGPNVLLLGHHGIDESGAYFLGLAPLAVWATSSAVTRRGFVLAIAAGAATTTLLVSPGWSPSLPPSFSSGIRELHDERKIVLLVATQPEVDAVRTSIHDITLFDLRQVIALYAQLPDPAPRFPDWFDQWFARLTGDGRPLVLTESAVDFFSTVDDARLRAFWREHVPAHYELQRVERDGFEGWLLIRR